MKLWIKSIAGVGAVGVVGAAVGGGLYAYSKSDASKGSPHFSSRGLENNLEDFKEVETYKAELRDPNNTAKKLANYDIKSNKIDGKNAQDWIESYIKDNQSVPPALFVQAGPIEFQNFYPEVVLPADFIKFITWYSTNVPWTSGISSLSFFRIKRGIQYGEDGRSITLGDYAAEKQSTKRIRFMPDSFFKLLDSSSLVNDYADKGFTRDQLTQFITDINTTNNNLLKDNDPNELVKVYSIAKRDGLYYPTISTPGDGIFKIDEKSPFLKQKVSDVDVQVDLKTGQTTISDKTSYKIVKGTQIPRLTLWRSLAEEGKWKGIDVEWLKYVTHHEYAHMQTMGMVSDAATSPIQSGVSPNAAPLYSGAGGQYDLDEMNRYLSARAPQVRAVRVKVLPKLDGANIGFDYYDDDLQDWKDGKIADKPVKTDYSNIAYEFVGASKPTRETFENIFGSNIDLNNPTKAPYQIDVDDLINDVNNGHNPRFFMQSVNNLRAFAKWLGIPMSTVVLMNAFDNMIATTSPHISTTDKDHPVRTMMYMVKDPVTKEYTWADAYDAFASLTDSNGETLVEEDKAAQAKADAEAAAAAATAKAGGTTVAASGTSTGSSNGGMGGLMSGLMGMMSSLGGIGKAMMGSLGKTGVSDTKIIVDGHYYKINPKAIDNNGDLISKDPSGFITWFNTVIVPNLNSQIEGRKDLLGGPSISGAPELKPGDSATADAFKKNAGIKGWMKNPGYSSSANLGSLFSDYNYLFTEVLVRDWLQMSMVQDDVEGETSGSGAGVKPEVGEFTQTSGFKYQSKFGNIRPSETGIELYADPSVFLPEEYVNPTKYVTDKHVATSIKNGLKELFRVATLDGGSLTMNKDIKAGDEWKYWEAEVSSQQKYDMDKIAGSPDLFSDMMAMGTSFTYGYLKGDWKTAASSTLVQPQEFLLKSNLFGFDGYGTIMTTNNGYSQDRWLRASLTNDEDVTEGGTKDSWTLYDNDGVAIPTDESKGQVIHELISSEDSDHDGLADTRVRAYWNFFIKARGIGLRTVTKMWRVPDRDAFAMWGYVPLKDTKDLKFLQFKNKVTGEVHYAPIKTAKVTFDAAGNPIKDADGKLVDANGNPTIDHQVDNLFYYEHQGDASTKHTLEQDGYTGWTIDYLSMGTWYNSELENGEWEMNFVDADHKEVMRSDDPTKRLMSLGESDDKLEHKDYITENGLAHSFASVYIERTRDDADKETGLPVMKVRDQFPV